MIAADIDPRHTGNEYWEFNAVFNFASGEKISDTQPWPNFRIWWDGDTPSEPLNRETVEKWDPASGVPRRLIAAHRDGTVDSWRDAPLFCGDILGDWREEIISEHGDHDRLMIFSTTDPTDAGSTPWHTTRCTARAPG